MVDALESFGRGSTLTTPIPVIGGGSRSDIVLQTLADALSHPVARAEAGLGGAALGAALLAEVGAGLRSASALEFSPALGPTRDPTQQPGLKDRLAAYQSLYRALRPFAARP